MSFQVPSKTIRSMVSPCMKQFQDFRSTTRRGGRDGALSLEAGDLHFRNLSPPLPPSLFWVAHLAWSVRQAVSRLNYWSFAQHALDRGRGESLGRRTNICGVVVMWGLNRWDWAAALQGDENNRSNGTVFVKTA